MAETISAVVNLAATATQTITAGGTVYSGNPSVQFPFSLNSTDVTKLYQTILTVTTSPTTLNVTSLIDNLAQALNFATVKYIQIVNTDATRNLLVNQSGTNLLFAAPPTLAGQTSSAGSTGSCLVMLTPVTVSGSVKNIVLTSSAGSISVKIMIAGT